MKNGLPIYEGDIVLDNLITGPITGSSSHSPASPRTLGLIYPSTLWPVVSGVHQVPYTITNDTSNVDAAIAQYNATFSGLIQWVPRTTQTDYVTIQIDTSDNSGAGYAYIGRVGGAQVLHCAVNCTVGTLAHEMGHSTGLYHEQSRPDRNTYVTLNYSHIQANQTDDAIATDNDWVYGPYDFASIMQYQAFSLTADGSQTIQSIPAGIPLSNATYYTTADIDTIRRIYSAAPTSVTIDTNPTGLQVVVDGSTVTAPQTYSWTLNSAHTLAIPAGLASSGLQAQGQFDYQFGKWNDGGAASHSISISPGSGMPGYPPTSPAQTVYTANFIQWAPFSPSSVSFPSGAGTLSTTPAPTTFAGVGQFFLAYEPVALHGNANSGYNFIQWFGSYSCGSSCYISFTENPLNLDYWVTSSMEPAFTTRQVTTIATNPPGLDIQVDGTDYTSPISFTPDPSFSGSAWAAGTTHFINAPSPQLPFSGNTSYVWSNWSDALSVGHSITVPTGSSTITANYNTQVGLVLTTNSSCAGTVAANPPGPSNTGTPVQFTATPSSGYVFTKWEGGLSGSVNPLTQAVNQEEFVQADFNTIATPLGITSISPSSVGAGSAPFTLTINGTGFVPPAAGGAGGIVNLMVGGTYYFEPLTYISPTQLQVPVTAAEVANPGAIQVLLQNSANGSCPVTVTSQLAVAPALQPTISGLSPSSATPGSSTFTLTVNGADFVSGATVKWNGTPLTTSFVNSIQLTATVPGTLLTTAGTATITVVNPDTTTSTGATFTIGSPPPAATPLFSEAGGAYAGTQMVMLYDTTPGEIVYYTTNETLPSTASTFYNGTPITVSSSETIEAIAVASGYSQSAVASATYIIPAASQSTVFLNGNGTVASFGPGGSAGIAATGGGGLSAGALALAIDDSGDFWIAGTTNVVEFNKSGSPLSGSGYTGGGLGGASNASTGIAVDGLGYVWVTNSNGSLTWLNNAGSPQSSSAGFTGGGMSSPSAAAVDSAGTVWVTNSGNNSVTRVFGAANPATVPLATGVANGTLGTRP